MVQWHLSLRPIELLLPSIQRQQASPLQDAFSTDPAVRIRRY